MDFLHKLSTQLVDKNQVLAVESLSVTNMLKNRHLAKSIADASWSEFLRQVAYKATWTGRTLLECGGFFPSSKTCSACKHVLPELALSVREWTCPACGPPHDRDVNAAINILEACWNTYTAGLAGSACGGTVRRLVPA